MWWGKDTYFFSCSVLYPLPLGKLNYFIFFFKNKKEKTEEEKDQDYHVTIAASLMRYLISISILFFFTGVINSETLMMELPFLSVFLQRFLISCIWSGGISWNLWYFFDMFLSVESVHTSISAFWLFDFTLGSIVIEDLLPSVDMELYVVSKELSASLRSLLFHLQNMPASYWIL